MTEKNGNNQYWVRWLIGILWGILVFALTGLANGVINNDKESRSRDTLLSKDIGGVQADISSIKTSIQYIREDSKAMFDMQKNILKELKK